MDKNLKKIHSVDFYVIFLYILFMENLIPLFVDRILKVSNFSDFINIIDWLGKNAGCGVIVNGYGIEYRNLRVLGISESHAELEKEKFLIFNSKNGTVSLIFNKTEETQKREETLKLLCDGIEKIFELLLLMEKEKKARNFLEGLVNSLNFPVFMMDRKRILRFANKVAKDFFGEDIIGKNCYEVVHKTNYPPVFCLFDDVIKEKKMIKREIYDWNFEKFFEITHYPLIENEEIEYVIGMIRDITDVVESKRTVAQSSRMVFLGEMASAIAHELNNPLSAILGISEILLLREDLNDNVKKLVNKIKEAAMKSDEIIKSILRFARESISQKEKENFEINAAINEVLNFIKVFIEKEGIKLSFEKKEEYLYIFGNRSLFQQVVLNLLTNSKDAIREKGEGGNIWIRTYKKKGKVFLEVEDTGKGIPPEIRNQIFLPFFTTKRPGKGTGLGLAFVKNIVEEHEGEIELESQVGKGTKFKISFPLPEKTPIKTDYIPEKKNESAELKILICDDEKFMTEFLKSGFKALGHTPWVTNNPLEVFNILKKEKFDILIFDIFMPRKRGDEIYEEIIKDFPEYKNKTVFITGVIADERIEKKIKDLNVPVYYKPLTIADLPQIILHIRGK